MTSTEAIIQDWRRLDAENKTLRAEAIELHETIWLSESIESIHDGGWRFADAPGALRSARRLVELGVYEQHPECDDLYRRKAEAAP